MRAVRPCALVFLLTACAGEAPPQVATPRPPAPAPAPESPTPRGAVVTRRVVVSLSRKSGTSVTTTSPDGAMKVAFEVLENGRGPKVDADLTLAADGTLASFEAHGHHTMGTTITEKFASDGRRARWKSQEEQGEVDVPKPAFFVPMASIPDEAGLLVRALIKAGGSLPLLPGGTATLEKTTERVWRDKVGHETRLVGYAISGLELTPKHVWMHEDGTWFGVVSPWFSCVPEGFEDVIEPLVAEQERFDKARDARLAKSLARKPRAEGLVYTHGRVLDVERGKWLPDHTVVIVGNTIKAVGPSGKVLVPAGAEVVDLSGKAILPGLWDMHSHLGEADGVLDIASGVTMARDVGNDPDLLDDYKKRYDEGTAVGPHVLRMGFIEGRNEKAAASKVTAETEAEAKAAVETYARRGYEGIKIYNSVKPELVPLLAREAHARNMLVTGHIPVHMLAHEAVRAGYDGIEHVNMLFLNFFATHETDTRDTTRFTLVGEKAASLDLKSKAVTDFFALLKQKKTVIDPTVDAFEDLLVGEQGKITPGLESIADRLPVQARRQFLIGGLTLDKGQRETYRASFEKLLAMVKALHDAQVPLVVGTDALAGLMLHHELALYVRAGIKPADALRLATLEAARVMKLDKTMGSIAAGKAADLFVVDGDPLTRIDDLQRVERTVRGGTELLAAPLYATMGVTPPK